MGLSPKQQKFVAEYLVDGNATRAAIAAGYEEGSAHVAGSRLIKNDKVKSAIDSGLAAQKAEAEKRARDRNIVTKEQWLAAVAELAFSDIDEFVEIVPTPPLPKDATVEERAARAKNPPPAEVIRLTPTAMRKKGRGRLVRKISVSSAGSVSFELHPKLPALELLAKHFGWIAEKIDLPPGTLAAPGIPSEDLKNMMGDPEAMKLARLLAQKLSKKPNGGKGPDGGK